MCPIHILARQYLDIEMFYSHFDTKIFDTCLLCRLVLKEANIQKLIFERKCLRRIHGPIKEKDGAWRIKTNEELDHLIKHSNLINQIRIRLSWFGNVQSMSDSRMIKKIYKWKFITTRLQGKPKSRCDDNVKQDICKMKIQNWTVCVQDRGKWRDVVEKAKTFNT
jgi:hypothetical protein